MSLKLDYLTQTCPHRKVRRPSANLTTFEFKVLSGLSKKKILSFKNADKGNTTVILNKVSCIKAIEEILNEHIKFSNLNIPAGREINYITSLEKRNSSNLKLSKIEETINNATYKNIKLVGSRPGILYGL